MKLIIIVATDRNFAIGKNQDMPWYLPADLKYFKQQTLNHSIVMGRKCFESIGKPLPKRKNIVITRNRAYKAEGTIILHSLQDALAYCKDAGDETVYIIGGGEIYREALAIADEVLLTAVDFLVEGADVYFPQLDLREWDEISRIEHQVDEKNVYNYAFVRYVRNII